MFIYRISHADTKATGKKVILRKNEENVDSIQFPHAEYHQMSWVPQNAISQIRLNFTQSFTPIPQTPPNQFGNTSFNDTNTRDITDEKWVTGMVIYNLFEDPRVHVLFGKWGKKMEANMKHRTKII